MDEEYVLRGFQDAKVVKPATVTIEATEYEVTPAQVQGKVLKEEDLNYMDEGIKKLYDAKLINKTVVELKTVAEEAPTQCEEGDLYYNTTTNLIYKATGSNVWGTTGDTPSSKYLYVDKTNSKLHYYDGQDFKSYGGGGGINLVTEDGALPTELFIESDSFATTGTEVVNSLNGNEVNKAPSVRAVNDEFDELNVYSTEERQIGWWEYANSIRKPIYRKNFSGTFKDEQTILDDIDMVLVYGGIAYISSLGRIVPYYEIFDGNVYAFRITKKGNQINTIVFAEGNPITADAEFYVEYTKTTDTPILVSEGDDE